MMNNRRVLVAGATGYLGNFLVKELKGRGYWIRALSRDMQRIEPVEDYVDDVFLGEATEPETIKDLCKDVDVVVSSLGITRQKDGLSYMDVDYHANRNILTEALAHGVARFMYISVFNSDKLQHLEIVKAKERFVQELILSDMKHIIVRPNGFFSDMADVFNMAKRGRVYLFGRGEFQCNPIHGKDLAQACIDWLEADGKEFDIGGPEILSQNEIARQAFEVLEKHPKISYIPLWIRNLIVASAKMFTSVKAYGPMEFFLTVLAMDMVAPTFGEHTLKDYFTEIQGADDV